MQGDSTVQREHVVSKSLQVKLDHSRPSKTYRGIRKGGAGHWQHDVTGSPKLRQGFTWRFRWIVQA